MMSSGRKRWYILLMLLGVAALVADRLVLSDLVATPASVSASPLSAAPVMPAMLSMPELPFPKNLEPYAPTQVIRDLFMAPADSRSGDAAAGEGKSSAGRGGAAGKADGELRAAQFIDTFQLEGLLEADGVRMVIVNGHWLQVGQRIRGCTLETVIGRSAKFRCSDGLATLKIGGDDPATKDRASKKAADYR